MVRVSVQRTIRISIAYCYVRYGLRSILALRVLQLRINEGYAFPLVARVLKNDIYINDILFGGDTVKEAVRSRDQLVALFAKGCFPLTPCRTI